MKYNIICKNCNKEFETNKKDRIYCCMDCRREDKRRKYIEKECKICGKKFEVPECYRDRYKTCSSEECSSEYQKILNLKKSKNKREELICEYCQKNYLVLKSQLNRGRKSRFCSMECRNKWESENKRGENHHNFGIKYSEEKIKKMRETTVQLYEKGVYDKQSKPQKITNNILDNLNINYKNECGFKYYLIDNFLIDYNLGIEVNGDYFHTNPLFFEDLNSMQYTNIGRDKRKRTYLRRYGKFEILYLWENDIINNIELCKLLILKYINNNGILENYNSFNYVLNDNNELVLNNKIVIPYINMSNKELKYYYNIKN